MHNQRLFPRAWQQEFPSERKCPFFKACKAFSSAFIRVETITSIIGIDQAQSVGMPVIISETIGEVGIPRGLQVCMEISIIRCLRKPVAQRIVSERAGKLDIVTAAFSLTPTSLAGLRPGLSQGISKGAVYAPAIQEITPL